MEKLRMWLLVNGDRKVKLLLKLAGFPSNSSAFYFRTVSSVTGYKGKLNFTSVLMYSAHKLMVFI